MPQPQPVPRQEWPQVTPPEFGQWTPELSVTVVLPAKDCQDELDPTLAALAEQTYPDALFDVVVVDDGSSPALRIPAAAPANARIVRLEPGSGHGSGRARHAGAEAATGDVILFLDADIVPTRTHVEAHARWHHVLADAVVLGRKYFVDFEGITAAAVRTAARDDTFDELLGERKRRRHSWFEDFIKTSKRLTDYGPDTFIAVVGASVSTPRSLYAESGGFSALDLRGIVDTEFGYRIFTAGAVIVPEPQALGFHQGDRNFSIRGDEIKRERSGLAANLLPVPLFRPSNVGRTWSVPTVRAVVDAVGAAPEAVQLTVDSLLASSVTDLLVTVSHGPGGGDDELPRWLRDYFTADARVSYVEGAVPTGFPAPHTMVVPAGIVVGPDTVEALVAVVSDEPVGVVRATVPGEAGPGVELWVTRALHRARRHLGSGDLEAAARQLFGEAWRSGETVGVRRAVVGVTRQGMLVDESKG